MSFWKAQETPTRGIGGATATRNGIVTFLGGVALYKDGRLVGGIGVSGDGVDQDEAVAFAGRGGIPVGSGLSLGQRPFAPLRAGLCRLAIPRRRRRWASQSSTGIATWCGPMCGETMDPTEFAKLALSSIPDALKAFVSGKEVVTLHLKSGQTLTGALTQVGPQLVHLSELTPNRQFYDALVQVTEVAALEARVRSK
jgi:hypothetical protein